MPALDRLVQPLREGEQLSAEEFMSRWEALPDLKHAELIEGIVYLASPVGNSHGSMHARVTTWLGTFYAFTPGFAAIADAYSSKARDFGLNATELFKQWQRS